MNVYLDVRVVVMARVKRIEIASHKSIQWIIPPKQGGKLFTEQLKKFKTPITVTKYYHVVIMNYTKEHNIFKVHLIILSPALRIME